MDKPFAIIIEDDRDVAALFRHILDLAGFQTEVIFHGQVAIERLSTCQPDIVLLDLNLPGVSGSQILDMIRKKPNLTHAKVIVITGYPHVANGLPVQPDLILLKPVSPEQLTNLIRRITLSEKSPKAIPLKHKPLDGRTGLYNQSFFKNRLESSLKQSREIDNYRFAVLLFKVEPKARSIDQAGRDDWELVVREVGASLRSMLRPTDTIARFDPDTFYMLFENVPNGEILVSIANRLEEKLHRSVAELDKKIKIPIRIGILLCDQGYENIDVILSDAKYAQTLAVAQGDEYSKYYYQFSPKKTLSWRTS
jgi:two-component system, OmpR family, response regulator